MAFPSPIYILDDESLDSLYRRAFYFRSDVQLATNASRVNKGGVNALDPTPDIQMTLKLPSQPAKTSMKKPYENKHALLLAREANQGRNIRSRKQNSNADRGGIYTNYQTTYKVPEPQDPHTNLTDNA